jgi:hypothetical protein
MMGLTVFWIENLAASLLFVATVAACAGRLRRRWLRIGVWSTVETAIALFYAAVAALAAVLQFHRPPLAYRFWPALALAILFLAGSLWLGIKGLRRDGDGTTPTRAGTWPRGRLAVALAVALALHLMTFWNLDLALRHQMAECRAEAAALALSVAPPRIADRDNAAIVYEQAFDGLPNRLKSWDKISPETYRHWAEPDQPGFDARDPQLRRFLQTHANAIALLVKAAGKPGCYFEHDYYWPRVGDYYPELDEFRESARLLVLDARTKAANGDVRGAMRDIDAILAVSQCLRDMPTVVCLLVSITIEGMAVETLQHVVMTERVSSQDLSALRLEDVPSLRRSLERTMREEEAFQLALFADMEHARYGPAMAGPLLSVWRVLLLTDFMAGHREMSQQLRQTAAKPYYLAKPALNRLDNTIARASSPMFGIMYPAMSGFFLGAARAEAYRQAAQLGLAAIRYRDRHGRLPARLDDLAPEFIGIVPTDPFDGRPMKMKRSNRGLIVYSVGPDQIDDGGAPFDQYKLTGDIAFEVPDRKP